MLQGPLLCNEDLVVQSTEIPALDFIVKYEYSTGTDGLYHFSDRISITQCMTRLYLLNYMYNSHIKLFYLLSLTRNMLNEAI